jgi:5,10-methylenetetrahydromethanopterin reductase
VSRLSISIGISPRESFADWMAFTKRLEDEGAGRIWLIDSQLAMKDVYVGLATAAIATDRLELGTGVTNLVTRHPTVTANAIASIGEVSQGRALLGLGAGDSAVYGLGKTPSRMREIESSLRFFRAVFSGGEGEWEGRRFSLPQPPTAVKVYLAVTQEKMCRLAGRLADGAIVMGPAQQDVLGRQVRWVLDGMAEEGRDRSEVEICAMTTMSVDDDVEKASRDVRSWATAQARLLADVADLPESLGQYRAEFAHARSAYDYAEHLSTRADHQEVISEELVRTLAIVGTADECNARLAGLHTTGVDGFIFPLMGSGRIERLRVLRDAVAPALLSA